MPYQALEQDNKKNLVGDLEGLLTIHKRRNGRSQKRISERTELTKRTGGLCICENACTAGGSGCSVKLREEKSDGKGTSGAGRKSHEPERKEVVRSEKNLTALVRKENVQAGEERNAGIGASRQKKDPGCGWTLSGKRPIAGRVEPWTPRRETIRQA